MITTDKPIVLIHGLMGSLSSPVILEAFGENEVHAPDLIGYGSLRDAETGALTLADQAAHVAGFIRELGHRKAHVVGHSVGGAVAALVAIRFPELVASLTSVEGNFTLEDAFWSGQIAQKPDEEVVRLMAEMAQDPEGWIAGAGVPRREWATALAREWLGNQPASTLKAQAKAVIAATAGEAYLAGLRGLMASGMPVYLVAGARSAEAWHVPDWGNRMCRMRINMPHAGHLMMAENPDSFAKAILTCLAHG